MSVSAAGTQQERDIRVSDRVVAAIADRESVNPCDLEPRLYDVIDPDALDTLFRSAGMTGEVAFTYRGYEITVRSDGELILDPVDE